MFFVLLCAIKNYLFLSNESTLTKKKPQYEENGTLRTL